MKTLLEMISRNWKRLKFFRHEEDFDIFEFDHQPYIECYQTEENSGQLNK